MGTVAQSQRFIGWKQNMSESYFGTWAKNLVFNLKICFSCLSTEGQWISSLGKRHGPPRPYTFLSSDSAVRHELVLQLFSMSTCRFVETLVLHGQLLNTETALKFVHRTIVESPIFPHIVNFVCIYLQLKCEVTRDVAKRGGEGGDRPPPPPRA